MTVVGLTSFFVVNAVLVQSEQLVDLLLNTIMLSVPISGGRSNNFLSFSHGEYFYSLFQATINAELLKSLESTVPRLMKASTQNLTMVVQHRWKHFGFRRPGFEVGILSSGEHAAERHAGPQLQRALCEEDSGEKAG